MPTTTQNRYLLHRQVGRSPAIRKHLSAVIVALGALVLLANPPLSQAFPGSPIDSRTLRIQEKVEELFEAGEFERALFIYKNELAPIGDKYAQYMVGYMYLIGAGVEEDPVTASAWYRLAAERPGSEFEPVRDQLVQSLGDVEKGRSDELYLQLKREYSDAVILMELIREDLQALSARTGSRISSGSGSGGSGSVLIVDPRAGSSISGDAFYRRLGKGLSERISFLLKTLGKPDAVDPGAARVDVAELEELVREYVETIDDR